jgi:hypothetical protein
MALLVACHPCPPAVRARAAGADLVPFEWPGFGGWDELHRELEPLLARLDSPRAEWPFFDTWSHFLVSEMSYVYAMARYLQQLVRDKSPDRIFLYLPDFHHRGLTLAETLDVLQDAVGVPLIDLTRS